MAEIHKYEDHEEFYALFVRVDGERGTVLIFAEDVPDVDKLASELAAVLDTPT